MPPRISLLLSVPARSVRPRIQFRGFSAGLGSPNSTTTPPTAPDAAKPSSTTAPTTTTSITARLASLLPTTSPQPPMDHISSADLQKLQSRFYQGDIYAPHDLSHHHQRSRRQRRSPAFDAADLLGIDFRKEYKNFCLLSEYVSEMGRIKHSSETGLRPVNQRRMARAVRRAIALGFMPATHRHPEYIMRSRERWEGRGGIFGGGGGRVF